MFQQAREEKLCSALDCKHFPIISFRLHARWKIHLMRFREATKTFCCYLPKHKENKSFLHFPISRVKIQWIAKKKIESTASRGFLWHEREIYLSRFRCRQQEALRCILRAAHKNRKSLLDLRTFHQRFWHKFYSIWKVRREKLFKIEKLLWKMKINQQNENCGRLDFDGKLRIELIRAI